MAKLKWGGLKCADCGNNDLKFHVVFTGADWIAFYEAMNFWLR